MDRHLTNVRQRFDKDWISRPISVQPTVGEEYQKMEWSIFGSKNLSLRLSFCKMSVH